ncbi:hypothetical protein Tco_1036421 [Tanacetum coccineum]
MTESISYAKRFIDYGILLSRESLVVEESNKEKSTHRDSKQVGFKHRGHKQVGFRQLGLGVETGVHGLQVDKRVWFEVELQGALGNRKADVFSVSNDDVTMAQRRLEDK